MSIPISNHYLSKSAIKIKLFKIRLFRISHQSSIKIRMYNILYDIWNNQYLTPFESTFQCFSLVASCDFNLARFERTLLSIYTSVSLSEDILLTLPQMQLIVEFFSITSPNIYGTK